MKRLIMISLVVNGLSSCVAPPPGGVLGSNSDRYPSKQMAKQRTANPQSSPAPIQPGETSSAYRLRQARQQREAIPTSQYLDHQEQSGLWGRSSQTSLYQTQGGLVEEVHVGNTALPGIPGQVPYTPSPYQGGFVPRGTSAVYDPVTGRLLPVRR